MAPQNQGTVALLTAGKVHILAPVARSFGRNPPCYPGDRKVKALRSPLDPFTVSVWMKIGDWSQNRDFGGNGTEFVMGFKFVHVLTSNHSTTSPYISIVGSCLNTVNSGVCEGLGFPSLKKTHIFVDPLCEPLIFCVPNIHQRSRACHPKDVRGLPWHYIIPGAPRKLMRK